MDALLHNPIADMYGPYFLLFYGSAIAFANFITNVAQNEDLEPAWVGDLVRYEKAWLLAYEPVSSFTVCWFRYTIHRDCTAQPNLAIWFRWSGRSQLRHIILTLPK
jgi:hypothetical protein